MDRNDWFDTGSMIGIIFPPMAWTMLTIIDGRELTPLFYAGALFFAVSAIYLIKRIDSLDEQLKAKP